MQKEKKQEIRSLSIMPVKNGYILSTTVQYVSVDPKADCKVTTSKEELLQLVKEWADESKGESE